MSIKILSSSITNLNTFITDPEAALRSSDRGVITLLDNNIPKFVCYAVTPKRMAELLAFEKVYNLNDIDVILENNILKNKMLPPHKKNIKAKLGKFVMYEGWKPDSDFLRMAAIWGYIITVPVMMTELASFISYWQAEEKYFYHVQWQQKLARSVYQQRMIKSSSLKRDINSIGEQYHSIPKGFRG
ncbi:DnaT-like ssDNA-binding domain-containing protein [Candidatus Profftia sp. (ex Adelges kitamiensis)]|uniref:DnaT-like ssDNA-binding domain-containing protein n=1 Tax=Candidatus Profftia sp. (ex Adelges kitamiensis) TaxID=2864218 RepID=UPI001CE381FF|nr:DnaT-like ssDNA-binding domain-containing protein [Candidatus Profftia sp. (ex Adelges kitamiensis)]